MALRRGTNFGASLLLPQRSGWIVVANQGTQEIRFFDAAGKYLASSWRGGIGSCAAALTQSTGWP
jgi:hypothetical protein